MAKRATGLGLKTRKKSRSHNSHKTAKRLEAKRVMLELKASKRRSN